MQSGLRNKYPVFPIVVGKFITDLKLVIKKFNEYFASA